MIPGWQMEAYQRLRTEIVWSAVKDYKKALKKSERDGAVCREQRTLERWFLSKWGQMLSGDNGEYIIEHCRQTYKHRMSKYGKGAMSSEKEKKIQEDLRNGLSKREISRRYNISRYQVDAIDRGLIMCD